MKNAISVEVPCPGCKLKTNVSFQKPGFMRPTICSIQCSACMSQLLLKFEQPVASDGLHPDQIKAKVKLMKASQLLADMIIEDQQMRDEIAQTQGEQNERST